MNYLDHIRDNAREIPDSIALQVSHGQSVTYAWLWAASEAIASAIDALDLPAGLPIIVYGHKSPEMIACFHGCLKSGHAYVPIDMHSVPNDRARNIAEQIGEGVLVLATDVHPFGAACTDTGADTCTDAGVDTCVDAGVDTCTDAGADANEKNCDGGSRVIELPEIREIIKQGGTSDPNRWVSGEDVSYIIFTSGSTGTPKGVQVTADCIDNFCPWALSLGGVDKQGKVFLNQAPFSFDLSVYELAMSPWIGGTLFALTKEDQSDMRQMMDALASSDVKIWVSTPSFADMCLADKTFDSSVVDVELFLFCGETLTNETVRRLRERFPQSVIMNTYGPTESTVAVTEVVVTEQMQDSPVPVPCGRPRPGTRIAIVAEDGTECPVGQNGEVVIQGDTVALGYYKRPDLTEKAFGTTLLDGKTVRTYRTGDEGCLDETGMLHYRGRIDLQIKLNGFRIELGEIEENLRKIDGVSAACVIPAIKNGKLSHLVAHIVFTGQRTDTDFREGLRIKKELESFLPHYMIPKKVVFHDNLPMTGNGKVDRKQLAAL